LESLTLKPPFSSVKKVINTHLRLFVPQKKSAFRQFQTTATLLPGIVVNLMHASHIAPRKRQIINPHFAFLGSKNPITRPATVSLAAPDSPTKSQQ
jgi:hypothetical protein